MQGDRVSRAQRPSALRRLLELPFRILWVICLVAIRTLIFVRRFVPASLLLLLCAMVPIAGLSLRWLDGLGSWLMLAAAIMLAFAAGSLRGRR